MLIYKEEIMTYHLPRLRSKSESIGTRDSIFDDLFNEIYSLPTSFLSKSGMDLSPRIDISETDAEYKIEAELPGINQKEIDVNLHGFTPVVSSRLNSRVQAALAPNLLSPAAQCIF
jgi:HSP20 family molecular chaperone IbpA